MKSHDTVLIGALMCSLSATVSAGWPYSGEVWESGDNYHWHYGVRDKGCETQSDCVERVGTASSKKEARRKARQAAKEKNKEEKESKVFDDGRGNCSEPGVNC